MDRPVPTLTRYPCKGRTRQDFSSGLRVRTVFEAVGAGEFDSALLPRVATPLEASSPRATRNATTASPSMLRLAVNARRKARVVNA